MNLANRPPLGQKKPPFARIDWRESARGKECQLKLACCNRDPETTVLCHLRMFGWAGINQKPDDYLAIYGCSDCHDALDGRGSQVFVDGWDVVRALGNTLMIHHAEGRIK